MEPVSNPDGASPADRPIQIAPDGDQLDTKLFTEFRGKAAKELDTIV